MNLNFAPKFDDATRFSYKWNLDLMKELDEPATMLLKEDATRENLKNELAKRTYSTFIFYNHGSKDSLIDQNGDSCIDTGNCGCLSGMDVYTMCCLAAKKLGAASYRKGCKSWWGYDDTFTFTLQDENIFGKLANMGLLLIRKDGLSKAAAVTKVKEAYDEAIDENEEEGGDPWTSFCLVHDRNALVCWTDDNPPPSDCDFRNAGVRLFGCVGQHLTRTAGVALTMFAFFTGVTIHACASEMFAKGGYWEILSLQGEWIGIGGMALSALAIIREYFKKLSKK